MTILVVMGVSGSGKTTLGTRLARALGWEFLEGDTLHPPWNVEKMSRGIPLDDEDRKPWLAEVRRVMAEHLTQGRSLVITCSALKQSYRDYLAEVDSDGEVIVVYPKGSFDLIQARLAHRKGHYMPASLLESQFATLEEPVDAITVDAAGELDVMVQKVLRALRARDPNPSS